jgi:hypothetical protein
MKYHACMATPGVQPTWRRKTIQERARDHPDGWRARLGWRAPLISAALGACAGGLVVLCLAAGPDFDLLSALLTAIIVSLLCGVFVGFITFVVQLCGGLKRPHRPRVGICTSCFRLTLDGRKDTCECGGAFEDLDGWTLNRCPICGFDLRSSGERCPECGHELRVAVALH